MTVKVEHVSNGSYLPSSKTKLPKNLRVFFLFSISFVLLVFQQLPDNKKHQLTQFESQLT